MGLFSGIIGSLFGADKPNTGAAEGATQRSLDLQERMYEEGQARFAPWLEAGTGSLEQLQMLMGIGGDPGGQGYGSFAQQFGPEQFQEDPGYQFRLSEGNKALERQFASKGQTFSPDAAKALTGYSQDLASQEYGQAFNRYRTGQGDIFSRLSSISGAGQQAAGQTTALGQNYANAFGNLETGLANTQMAAQQAQQANTQSMFNTVAGIGSNLGAAYMLSSDRRLKENIVKVGEVEGINVYRFEYKDSPGVYEGVMAQELVDDYSHALGMKNGYLAVDYDKIPVNFREIVTCH